MTTPDEQVKELTRFIADPAPEPILHQLQIPEVLRLVRCVLIPAGWLANPTAFRDPGPGNH